MKIGKKLDKFYNNLVKAWEKLCKIKAKLRKN